MKKLIITIASLLIIMASWAQSPGKMSYQAVIRNSSDELLVNYSVGMQISILQGTVEGDEVYVERHFPTTNANGLVSIEIGTGIIVSGDFANIDWANGPYFVKTETDLNGGANYTITGISQLLSVPYALYAEKVGSVELSDEQIALLKGEQGDAGTDGQDGVNGSNGVDGQDGVDGLSAYEIAVDNGFEGTEIEWIASLVGEQGEQGISGSDGVNGLNGTDGQDGTNGLSAYEVAVAKGFVGTETEWLTSLIGAQGKQGIAGTDGNNGINGLSAYEVAQANGFEGTEADWLTSLVGERGIQGIAGVNGSNGADGQDGVDGLSAYEVAVANGFVGTETEWLTSLIGAQGEQGIAGTNGNNGINGLSAYEVAQANGFEGTEADWLTTLVGEKGIQGIAGVNGSNGADGQDGVDGLSAYEVAVANGFVGTETEWLTSLIGVQGEQGIAGTDGLTTSVNGVEQVDGEIILTKSDIDLANVDNTSDVNKPISTATQTALDSKVDIVSGKGLSTEDYTTAEKSKLAAITGINTGDQDLSELVTKTELSDSIMQIRSEIPVAISDLTMDANSRNITNLADPINNQDAATKAYVDALLKRIDALEIKDLLQNGLTDSRDNNNYDVVKIGNQIWMSENLKYLPSVVGKGIGSDSSKYYYVYGYNGTDVKEAKATTNYITYGALYNWPAALVACPSGWHLPSDGEWTILERYLAENGYAYDGTVYDGKEDDSEARQKIAKSMATLTGWSSYSVEGVVGNSDYPNKQNASGFSALPGGRRYHDSNYGAITFYGYWWSSTPSIATNYAYLRTVFYHSAYTHNYHFPYSSGFSIRCIKDDVNYVAPNSPTLPSTPTTTVMISPINNVVSSTSATLGLEIPYSGGSEITTCGVEYSMTPNFSKGSGTMVIATKNEMNDYIVEITGLSVSTTYFYRVYATNFEGTVYSEEVIFTTNAE